jgi:hypothetical protein
MGKETIEGLVTVAVAIVGVAFIAVLVSKNAKTSAILTAGGQALATGIQAATGPVTSTGWTGGAPMELPSF